MKKQYFAPLCEEVKVVSKMTQLQAASSGSTDLFLPVTNGDGSFTAE